MDHWEYLRPGTLPFWLDLAIFYEQLATPRKITTEPPSWQFPSRQPLQSPSVLLRVLEPHERTQGESNARHRVRFSCIKSLQFVKPTSKDQARRNQC